MARPPAPAADEPPLLRHPLAEATVPCHRQSPSQPTSTALCYPYEQSALSLHNVPTRAMVTKGPQTRSHLTEGRSRGSCARRRPTVRWYWMTRRRSLTRPFQCPPAAPCPLAQQIDSYCARGLRATDHVLPTEPLPRPPRDVLPACDAGDASSPSNRVSSHGARGW